MEFNLKMSIVLRKEFTVEAESLNDARAIAEQQLLEEVDFNELEVDRIGLDIIMLSKNMMSFEEYDAYYDEASRDCYGYEESVSDFERKAMNLILPRNFAYECSVGKVQRTISNYPYMRLHIDKWKENGASTREIILMQFLRNNI